MQVIRIRDEIQHRLQLLELNVDVKTWDIQQLAMFHDRNHIFAREKAEFRFLQDYQLKMKL